MKFAEYPFFILSLIGWLGLLIILLSKKIILFKKFADIFIEWLKRIATQTKKYREFMWQIPTAYAQITDEKMEDVAPMIINVLAVLAGIYGILFALIISEKASLVFVSWSFSIWCGWVLAILMRIGYFCSILLSDYYQWERKKKEKTLQGITIFIKHSVYLLIFTASYVPIFAIMKTVNIEEIVKIYPWTQTNSLFFGVLSIILIAFLIYTIILELEGFIYQDFSIYPYLIFSLWFIGLFSIYASPLAPRSSMWILQFFFDYPIPSVLVWIEYLLGLIGAFLGGGFLIGIFIFFHQIYNRILKN